MRKLSMQPQNYVVAGSPSCSSRPGFRACGTRIAKSTSLTHRTGGCAFGALGGPVYSRLELLSEIIRTESTPTLR